MLARPFSNTTQEQHVTQRCNWAASEALAQYHDSEWGVPSRNDRHLFEMLTLEGAQAGLSWSTILNKREGYRRAFANFDVDVVAGFTPKQLDALVLDASIVRHRGKIESVINNAKRARALVDEAGSLARFFWRFEPGPKERPRRVDYQTLLANTTSPASINLSSELKKRGWTFVGPTTVYAFMQAMGLVNDHIEGCHCRAEIETFRRTFKRPGM
jgi:DNA-3-methyladenine glycosylase I